uniref:Uncharacterized protein n=1 Tax=Oryza punctata TaxID=4537 RepID=A0A0E0K5F9_ORYPU
MTPPVLAPKSRRIQSIAATTNPQNRRALPAVAHPSIHPRRSCCISHSSPPLDLSSSLQHRARHRSSSRSPPSLSIFHWWSSQVPPLKGAIMSPARRCLLHSARIAVQSTTIRPQPRRCHLRSCTQMSPT